MPSLDANLLLRWLLDDVRAQRKAVDALLSDGRTYRVSNVALVEVTFVLERVMGLSRVLIADYLRHLLTMAALDIDRATWQQAADSYRSHPKLSIADCFLAAEAVTTGNEPLRTFDRKLANHLDGTELLGS